MLVRRAGRHERLQRCLDVDREARRAPLVWLQAVPEAAVIIAVTAQHVDDAGGRGPSKQVANNRRSAAALAQDEVSSCSELCVHARQVKKPRAAPS